MRYILDAFALVFRHPRLWRYILQPMGVSALLFLTIVIAGSFAIVPTFAGALQAWGVQAGISAFLGGLAYVVAWFFLAGLVFVALTAFVSSLMWERLSAEVEVIEVGHSIGLAPPLNVVLLDSLKRALLTLAAAVCALCASILPIVGPILVAGYVGTLDYTAPAYVRRGVLFSEQRRRVFRNPGWMAFYIAAGAISIVPFVNLLLMPVMVIAGTLMVLRGETTTAQPVGRYEPIVETATPFHALEGDPSRSQQS